MIKMFTTINEQSLSDPWNISKFPVLTKTTYLTF